MSEKNENINKRIAQNTMLLYLRLIIVMGVSLFTVRVVLKALGVVDYGIHNVVAGIVIDPKRADRSNISKQIQRNRSTARKQESVSLMDLLAEQQEDDFDAR